MQLTFFLERAPIFKSPAARISRLHLVAFLSATRINMFGENTARQREFVKKKTKKTGRDMYSRKATELKKKKKNKEVPPCRAKRGEKKHPIILS